MNHPPPATEPTKRGPRVIHLPWAITVVELAQELKITPSKVVAQLLEFGRCVTRIDAHLSFADAARVTQMNGVRAKPLSKEHATTSSPE